MIKVKNVRLISNPESKVKCFCTVAVDGIEINSVKVIRNGKQKFISFPSVPYEKDGETKYSNTVYITDDDLRKEIEQAVLKAYADEVL